jgi:hypothetical protein
MFSIHKLQRDRKLSSCLSLAAGFLLGLHPLAAQVGLGLSPMRTELRLTPGASYTGTLRLVNEGAQVRTRTTLLDFHLDAEQTPQFEDQLPEEAAYSCRTWLVANPMEAEINASGQVVVRYTIRVPADAQPRSYNCAAGFTSLPPASEVNGFGIRTAVRVVAAFYVIVGNPTVQGTLSQIAMEHIPGSTDMRAVLVLENSGKMFYRPTGSLTVLDPGGTVLETYEITPIPVLPERKQRLLFPLKKVADGQPCTIRVRVDLGTGEILEGSAAVQSSSAQ